MNEPTESERAADVIRGYAEAQIQRLLDEKDVEIFHLEETVSNLRESLEIHSTAREVLKKAGIENERLKQELNKRGKCKECSHRFFNGEKECPDCGGYCVQVITDHCEF